MILDVLAALQQNEAFQSRISSRYKFFLVDEHQDTNTAQNLVLELLCAEKNPPNIFIVGDEKQAIYRFQGANLENFLYVHKRYPSATLISLQENYRSTDYVLSAAHSLISHRKSSLATTLKSISDELRAATHAPQHASPPQLYLCPTHDDEHLFIAHKAQELIAAGTAPREIAVLVREHKDALPILHALGSEGVAHVWESSSNIWQDRFVRDTLRISDFLVSLVSVNPAHESICALEEKFFGILHIPAFGIPALDVWKLAPSVSHSAHHSGTLLDALSDVKLHEDLRIENPQALTCLAARITRWQGMMASASPADLFEEIIRATGVGEAMQQEGGDPRVYAATQALWQEFKNFFARPPASSLAGEVGRARNPVSSLSDFQAYLTLCQRQNIRLETKPQKNIQGVRIMTAHGAKGLEFDYVFIPHLHDAKWGRKKRAQAFRMPLLGRPGLPKGAPASLGVDDAYEDERRLLYVAVTRARKGIFMSRAERDEQGKELIPSLFVQEMGLRSENLELRNGRKERPGESYPNSFLIEPKARNMGDTTEPLMLPPFASPKKRPPFALPREKEFIADLFTRRKFSVTALNNYLECPWKYFYRNLVRIPQAPSRLELYGSAVHEALRIMFEDAARGERMPSETFLLNAYIRALERKLLIPEERVRLQARGKKALAAYWTHYNGSWNTRVRNEVTLTVPLNDSLILTGILDKLEIAPDGKTVVVVDYKTGRAKTRGEIEGTTKNSRGNLKRQLVFYKLLLDKNPIANFHMETGELDFIEPDIGGKLHREQFIISVDDVAALEAEILRVAEEIATLAFWDKLCLDRTCRWCKLRHGQ